MQSSKNSIIHFLNHIKSGKKLDIGNATPCSVCKGFGYPKPSHFFFIGKDISIIAKMYVDFDENINVCTNCNGDGMEPQNV